ncbi:membrane protein insertase YidC [Antarcticibacterium flavum]|uniref:Membrane protein insertase YidC n=1 Tax=Antarcticibacterium flavum TaxID=2058175 RepID=A0A5B7X6Y1_9FLAO|nr:MULTISPECIES: membrane protein insertase YidC [Antarcticibacterium]MCM4159639.1 membrane protein insertase YidC [Antarcticibacterium sp. W02-3]QCY70885.1 membrane protein insertase YidC [Antarcticibacterium flavum]
MEEKKFDVQSLIGFILIGGILIWMLYNNSFDEQATEAQQDTTEQVEQTPVAAPQTFTQETVVDSAAVDRAQRELGAFGYSATLPSATENTTTISNDVLELKVDNKGGYISEARLTQFETYNGNPVYLIKDGNASFNLNFTTTDGRVLDTENLYFEPEVSRSGNNQILTMRLKVSETEFLEYRYVLKPGEYMLDFSIRSQGLNRVLNPSRDVSLDWRLKGFRNAKSIEYENRYTELIWEYGSGSDDYLGHGDFTDDADDNITYVAFKQHFFTSILLTDTAFPRGEFTSRNLVQDEEVDTVYTKEFTANLAMELKGGELNYNLNWYYGPTDYRILNDYDRNLDEIVPLGWGIFGWINKYIFIPFFSFLASFLPSYGIAIIVMTIVVRIVLSPVTYKSYLSQAKMKVLRPEINELNEKYKDNPMKKQQETMKLYSKAGASPMSGCLPALMQIPVFYALFQFFPSAFDLRQKGFLWADDLSSYDNVLDLPFYIPFYGDHVSLFPILASIAIFIYMMMTTGQTMQQNQQPGMPNMKFIMYLSPLFMLVFFNNFASGLSLYYFTSNLITIGIMLVIKYVIIDEDKIHAKIQENKKKPKKQGKFARKMQEMMEQAEQQQKKNKK